MIKQRRSDKDVSHRVPNEPRLDEATISQKFGEELLRGNTIAMRLSASPLAKLLWMCACTRERISVISNVDKAVTHINATGERRCCIKNGALRKCTKELRLLSRRACD